MRQGVADSGRFPKNGGRGTPLPYSFTEAVFDWVGEALGPPAGNKGGRLPLIRLALGQLPSPYKGEGFGAGGSVCRPYKIQGEFTVLP